MGMRRMSRRGVGEGRRLWRLIAGLAGVCVLWATWLVPLDASPVVGVWQSPQNVPGARSLNVDRSAQVSVVSCSGRGECAAGGFYTDGAGHIQSFVVDERRGVWGVAREVPGSAALNAGGNFVPNAISCTSPGDCAVGGNYTDSSGDIQAWVADEAGGKWGNAQELPGTAALNTGGNAMVTSISCAGPGDCAAGGSYALSGTNPPAAPPFVASEKHGTWSPAIEVPGTATYATVNSVSCGSAGNCVAGGRSDSNPYVVTETSGRWGSAKPIAGMPAPGYIAEVTSVSCEPAGCDAVGTDGGAGGFGVTETGHTWGSAWSSAVALSLPVAVPPGGFGLLHPESISCTSPGECTAVGWYSIGPSVDAVSDQEGFTTMETGGTWSTPQTVPSLVALDGAGTGSIDSVSCSAPGDCAAVGLYGNDSGTHAAVLSETGSTWGTALPLSRAPGQAVSQSISCGAVAYCSVGGGYSADSQHYQAIVADETPVLATTTTETLSAATVTYGHEQAEKVSVAVSASLGIVMGKVTETAAGKRACTITLAGGKGSCTVPAAKFAAGRHFLTAAYAGALGFAASSSAAKPFFVVKAASKIRLTLSADKVRFGHERSEKLTVKVRPQFAGIAGGTVTIRAGRIRVCVITLKSGTGRCRLRERRLRAGKYRMRAAYHGNRDFTASASREKHLTVTR